LASGIQPLRRFSALLRVDALPSWSINNSPLCGNNIT